MAIETEVDKRHGGPYDSGSADAFYGRPFRPHYFEGGSHQSPEVTVLNEAQIAEYTAGYDGQFDRKVWA